MLKVCLRSVYGGMADFVLMEVSVLPREKLNKRLISIGDGAGRSAHRQIWGTVSQKPISFQLFFATKSESSDTKFVWTALP